MSRPLLLSPPLSSWIGPFLLIVKNTSFPCFYTYAFDRKLDCKMDWPCKKDEIQARYFFSGVQTHLCVYAEAGYVTWVFQFQDFGMTHTLCSSSEVTQTGSTGYLVNGVEHASERLAMDAVFEQHLRVFMEDLYAQLGVESHECEFFTTNSLNQQATSRALSLEEAMASGKVPYTERLD